MTELGSILMAIGIALMVAGLVWGFVNGGWS